ncbi:hypothetical protein CONPUDRAFT_163940 [Coniophora puteana RWD-64-598 SS2]|uniref:Uncharacterized protein n=1 Tax=Coniophora puteana (strain RWD-64-598) TaxID=741705 RepID=A0A5M3MUU1_CONPW|nr:uncharacterized protein CONPUDRAFT_163940 [Coniophora puteana RWD-64-598 SS2]EIW82876.1 hypothetical protein CONPUDRAFT_163940 [Coniophora puteana RWD-64-598 SS2]
MSLACLAHGVAIAPWFSSKFTSGAYVAVDKAVGDQIDWRAQISTPPVTTSSITPRAPGPTLPSFQIVASSVPADKFVIGKPTIAGDETSGGFMSTSDLASCL